MFKATVSATLQARTGTEKQTTIFG